MRSRTFLIGVLDGFFRSVRVLLAPTVVAPKSLYTIYTSTVRGESAGRGNGFAAKNKQKKLSPRSKNPKYIHID